jgi:hypothetical protein
MRTTSGFNAIFVPEIITEMAHFDLEGLRMVKIIFC